MASSWKEGLSNDAGIARLAQETITELIGHWIALREIGTKLLLSAEIK